MKSFVSGAAGFIGSNLTDRLLENGDEVIGWDNLSTGQRAFLEKASYSSRFHLLEGDNLDRPELTAAMSGCDRVFHLAANADVRFGLERPANDIEQNTLATFNVLEAMRANSITTIAFSSTGSVYGEATMIPTPEDAPFPIQTSLYAARKVAGETLIHSYCEGYGFEGYIFRFVSILGERYTHGHVFDFYRQLCEHPDVLRGRGAGRQRKSYLYVQDCLDAMLLALEKAQGKVNVFNLGTEEYCQVDDSVGWICAYLGVSPQRTYTGGERGWVGDSPFIFLDCARIRALGWRPRLNIREGVIRTVRYLEQNPWVLQRR